jgi:hypothetical protein
MTYSYTQISQYLRCPRSYGDLNGSAQHPF